MMIGRFSSIPNPGLNRKGFTLIEILVVLAIAAIISSITLGGFNEMRNGNKRVSCQTNLTQIYQAARLYASDEGGKFPFLGNISGTSTPKTVDKYNCTDSTNNSGIGLWNLYTFSDTAFTSPDKDKPIERYLRSSKVLHCPSHLTNGSLILTSNLYDPDYLSYQTCDGGAEPTYSSLRLNDQATDSTSWKRQLLHFTDSSSDADTIPDFVSRQPEGNTIVTYCLHHRGERKMDNVLFYDGSVQMLPQETNTADNWKRQPKDPS